MDLEQVLNTSISRLNHNRFENVAQIKQAVILPIIRALEWDDSDPNELKPEHNINNSLYDYVLFTNGKPQVLIKAFNQLDNENNFDSLPNFRTVSDNPLLILTDGKRWNFYLGLVGDVIKDKLFCSLDLEEGYKNTELTLVKFLHKNNIISGQSNKEAQLQLDEIILRKKANRAIGNAFFSLVNEPDELLLDLLIEKVESQCESKPNIEYTKEFLREISNKLVHDQGNKPDQGSNPSKGFWSRDGVILPNGTQLQMKYGGVIYTGKIEKGKWVVNGNIYNSPSGAASETALTKEGTKTLLNGWIYWDVKRPKDRNWCPLRKLRSSAEISLDSTDSKIELDDILN